MPICYRSAWRFGGTFQTDGVAITFLLQKFIAGYKRKRGNKKKVRQEDVYDDGIRRLHTLAADERAALANESDLQRIYCDPGKRDLITMMDDEDRFCRYRNSRRVHESKWLFYRRKGDRRRAEMKVDSSRRRSGAQQYDPQHERPCRVPAVRCGQDSVPASLWRRLPPRLLPSLPLAPVR